MINDKVILESITGKVSIALILQVVTAFATPFQSSLSFEKCNELEAQNGAKEAEPKKRKKGRANITGATAFEAAKKKSVRIYKPAKLNSVIMGVFANGGGGKQPER